jgi:hypothetical protein
MGTKISVTIPDDNLGEKQENGLIELLQQALKDAYLEVLSKTLGPVVWEVENNAPRHIASQDIF